MNDKDVIIECLTQRLDRLQNQNESLLEKNTQLSWRYQKQIDQLIDDIKTLSAEILELKEHVVRLEKNSATSSKPLSSDIIHPQTATIFKKKRKRGGQQGHPKCHRANQNQPEMGEMKTSHLC